MLKKIKINIIIILVALVLLLSSSCKKEEYILVENYTMSAYTSGLPEQYESYAIKSFAKGDYVVLEEIHSNNVDKLQVGDVVSFYDESINNINYSRIVYIERNDNNEIEALFLQGDSSASRNGVFDPNDNSKIQNNMYLLSAGLVISFRKSYNNLRQLKGKVIKVKYKELNSNDSNDW